MSQHPSEITPSLTEERLQAIAQTIVRVRADARDAHEPDKGDDSWSRGCRCYSRTCFALDELARTSTCFVYDEAAPHGNCDWLKVERAGLACTLYIDGEPMKFFCTDAENPSAKSLSRSLETVRQASLPYYEQELLAELEGWRWVLAIETHDDGSVMTIAVFQVNADLEVRNRYFIPLGTPAAVTAVVTPITRDGVDLPPPPVEPKLDESGESQEEIANRGRQSG